jgi:CRP/FNR family transcriptional regulator, cyclic AMP receptor protein
VAASFAHVSMAFALAAWVKWVVFVVVALLIFAVGWVAMRWQSSEQMGSLRGVRIFRDLTDHQLRSVARAAHPVEFPPGQNVTREGEGGHSLYLIEEGTAVVSAGGERKAILAGPAYVGEVTVIDGGPRTATITAETPLRALELSGRSLSHLLDIDPGFRRAVYVGLQEIVRSAGGAASDEPSTVDIRTLVGLCAELRRIQTPDWGQQEPVRARRSMLARRR